MNMYSNNNKQDHQSPWKKNKNQPTHPIQKNKKKKPLQRKNPPQN